MDLGRLEASGLSRRLLLFSRSVTSNSLRPHGLQHTQLPCPSPAPGTCSNSCPVSQWCHPTHLILCFPLLLLPSIFPSIRFFSNNLALCIRWPKYWSFSFSISPSNEYSVLISFRIDCFWTVVLEKTLESPLECYDRDVLEVCKLDFWSINSMKQNIIFSLSVHTIIGL